MQTSWFFWALASAFFAGVTAILAKVGVEKVDSNFATALRTSVIVIFTWAFFFAARGSAQLTGRSAVFIVLSGLATGASWLCYFRALQLGDASRVAPVDKLSLVFVLAFAAIFLHEKLSWQTVAGTALIVAGVILITTRGS